jgi:hypothetical protein
MGTCTSAWTTEKLNDVIRKGCFPLPQIDDCGHAGWSQMVLHSGPEERLMAGGSPSRWHGEDCLLNGSRVMAIHSHVLWPLKCLSDVWVVNGNRVKRPHLRVMSQNWTMWSWSAARSKSTCSNCENCSNSSEKSTQSSIRRSANSFRRKCGN